MIKTHEANSAWWGEPVGLITDAAFFDLDAAAQREALDRFAFVEFKSPLESAPSTLLAARAGFTMIDVQINFRIALKQVPPSASLAGYECRSASEEPFRIEHGDVRAFEHERFLRIPGITHEKLNARYVNWANEIIARNPDWCLRLSHEGRGQGWFLSEPTDSTLCLTLAMLADGAMVSGQHLYQCAMNEYATRGAGIGHASFSVRNTPVLNIYARLGAKFTPATGVWLWLKSR
jgi:hypothetical protein